MARYYTLTYEIPHEMEDEDEAMQYVRDHLWNEPTTIDFEEEEDDE